jgi:hypothetical protein
MYNAAIGWGFTDVAAWLEANEGSDMRVWDDEDVAELQADIGKMAVRAEGWLFFQKKGLIGSNGRFASSSFVPVTSACIWLTI